MTDIVAAIGVPHSPFFPFIIESGTSLTGANFYGSDDGFRLIVGDIDRDKERSSGSTRSSSR
jgi:hypothetical protein